VAFQTRPLTAAETQTIRPLAHARTEPGRRAERARIIWLSLQGRRAPASAGEFGICPATVRFWLKWFNAKGIAGLEDDPRPSPAPTYTPDQVSAFIATVLTRLPALGLPFANWTLDRFVAYLREERGITMKRRRVDEILVAEGIRWRTQENWCGERIDPNFARKRAPSFASLPSHRRKA
jgi:transposase